MQAEPLITYQELSEATGIPVGTLRDKVWKGEIPYYKFGPHRTSPVRFRLSEVLEAVRRPVKA